MEELQILTSTNHGLKVGDEIEIVEMNGEPEYRGKRGVITNIDAIGQIHGTWGGLAVIPEVDSVLKIEKGEN